MHLPELHFHFLLDLGFLKLFCVLLKPELLTFFVKLMYIIKPLELLNKGTW